jgi:septal ring factor EnvC (AmiA/AmiB activator)
MKLRPTATKTITASLLVCMLVSLFLSPFITPVYGLTLEEQLAQIEAQLAQIAQNKQNLQNNINNEQNKIGQYSGEIGKLSGQIQTLQLDISKLDLQIQEVNLNIQLLESQIAEKQTEIEENQEQATSLEDESDARIKDNYMNYRIHKSNSVDFFTVKSANSYFKDSQYKELIQEEMNKVLEELSALKTQLERDRADLEEKSINVLRSKAILDEQHSQLDRAQTELQSKINGYNTAVNISQSNINATQGSVNQLSHEEAIKLGQREQVRQALFNSFTSIANGQYVVAGTIIGRQGATGYAFGEHVHFQLQVNGNWQDPCVYLPGGGGPVNGGCGGNGSLQWPLRGSFLYTSSYWDSRWYGIHAAVDLAHYTSQAPVYASHDGWLFKGVDQYGGLYIIICQDGNNCNSGFKSGYWHFSSY